MQNKIIETDEQEKGVDITLPDDWLPPNKIFTIIDPYAIGWKPKIHIRTADWIAENIKTPGRSSDFGGHFSSNNFPYQTGVFDLWDNPMVREIYLQWGAQDGKSMCPQSICVKVAATDPSPMIFVCPDEDTAKEISDERVMPLAENVVELAGKLLPKVRRDAFKMDFGDCVCYMAYSGSPSKLGQKSCRYVFITEISKLSYSKSNEADPADLARDRINAFWDNKVLIEGTPTLKGVCRLEGLESQADQRLKFKVPCPLCGKRIVLIFGSGPEAGLVFEKRNGKLDAKLAYDTAHYRCQECKGKIEEQGRMAMIRDGIWTEEKTEIPKAFKGSYFLTPGKECSRVHLHLPSMYSPILSFGKVAAEFVRSMHREKKRTLQNFVNSWLAETFAINLREYKWEELKKVLDSQEPAGTVPPWVRFITAGADVQKGWGVYTIRGYGAGGRSRLIKWGQFHSFSELETWLLINSYGKDKMPVALSGIDARYSSYEVYEWVAAMEMKYGERVRAIMGHAKGAPYWMSEIERSGAEGRVIPGGFRLWNINDNHWKLFVTGKFGTPAGKPGSWEIATDVDEFYMRGITAEVYQETKSKRGQKRYEWVVVDTAAGNHYLDSEKINACMAEMIGWRDIEEMEEAENNKPKQRDNEQSERGLQTGDNFLNGSDEFWR